MLSRAQSLAFAVGVASLALGLLASIGLRPLPPIPAPAPPVLWAAGILLGTACGVLVIVRLREIERERWQWAEGPGSSAAERELAHAEAERARRAAGRAWFLAPVGLSYWLAWQVEPALSIPAAGLLMSAPIVGFAAGALAARLRG